MDIEKNPPKVKTEIGCAVTWEDVVAMFHKLGEHEYSVEPCYVLIRGEWVAFREVDTNG